MHKAKRNPEFLYGIRFPFRPVCPAHVLYTRHHAFAVVITHKRHLTLLNTRRHFIPLQRRVHMFGQFREFTRRECECVMAFVCRDLFIFFATATKLYSLRNDHKQRQRQKVGIHKMCDVVVVRVLPHRETRAPFK